MSIVESVKDWAVAAVSAGGYPGLMGLMALSAANVPVPSEVILPFSGVLVASGAFNLHAVAWLATIGTTIGSAASYWIGARLGQPFLWKYGKYVLLSHEDIERGDRFFQRWGLSVTLWGRIVPLVRSFVSLPAGFYKAEFRKFVIYCFIGTLPWAYAWTLVGFYVGKNWTHIAANARYVDAAILLLFALGIGRLAYRRVQESRHAKAR